MRLLFQSAVLLVISCSVFGQSDNECLSNKECPSDKLCAEFRCINPCLLNFCGNPLDCKVTNHIPICACTDVPSPGSHRGTSFKNVKKKYKLNFERLNWYGALTQCASQGMALASIESQEEQDNVAQLIKKSDKGDCSNKTHCGRWWLGAADLHEKGDHTWYSNGRLLSYRNFWPGEPSSLTKTSGCNELEYCIEMITGLKHHKNWNFEWNDTLCSLRQYFVCEYFE